MGYSSQLNSVSQYSTELSPFQRPTTQLEYVIIQRPSTAQVRDLQRLDTSCARDIQRTDVDRSMCEFSLPSRGRHGDRLVQQHPIGHKALPDLCRQEQGSLPRVQDQALRLPFALQQARF